MDGGGDNEEGRGAGLVETKGGVVGQIDVVRDSLGLLLDAVVGRSVDIPLSIGAGAT